MLASKTTEVRYVRKVRFISYPAGKYDHGASYVCTDAAGPFVELDGQYYAMYIEGTWIGTEKGITPAQDYALNGTKAVWRLMDKYLALFAEMIFADYAKLGSAVCLGDYMFSQYGIRNGVLSNAYQNFNPDNLDAFRPKIFIDWLRGYFEAQDGFFAGDLSCRSLSLQLSNAPDGGIYNNYLINNTNYYNRKFPRLANGITRSFEIIIPAISRTSWPYEFKGEDSTVYFTKNGDRLESSGLKISLENIQGCKFTVIGIGETDRTYWNIYPGNLSSEAALQGGTIS